MTLVNHLISNVDFLFQSQDERYIQMLSPKDEVRYSSERQVERYHDERIGYYRERELREDRDSNVSGNGNIGRHSQEADPDRGN